MTVLRAGLRPLLDHYDVTGRSGRACTYLTGETPTGNYTPVAMAVENAPYRTALSPDDKTVGRFRPTMIIQRDACAE